jgi:hypothetical protein
MIEDVFLLEEDASFVTLLAEGESPVEEAEQAWIFVSRRPSVYHVPYHKRDDDLDEQLEDAAREAMLQQLAEARGVAAANRMYEKRIEDQRALSLLSAQRNAAVSRDPLHRPLPTAAASAQKDLKAQRATEPHMPERVRGELDTARRDAALADAQAASEAKRKREEEIRQARLKNLEKARKARRK